MSKIVANLLGAFFFTQLISVAEGEFCSTYRSGYHYYYSSTYCAYGCCGSSYNQYCCSNEAGIIAGSVIGAFAFVIILVTVICCCIKKQGYQGRTIGVARQPVANGVTVIHSSNMNTTTMGGYPTPQTAHNTRGYYGTPVAPPPYQPPYQPSTQPPNAFTYSDPAYPPGFTQPGPGVSGNSNPPSYSATPGTTPYPPTAPS